MSFIPSITQKNKEKEDLWKDLQKLQDTYFRGVWDTLQADQRLYKHKHCSGSISL